MKHIFCMFAFCLVLLLIPTTAMAAETGGNADSRDSKTFAELFPDANFRQYVTETVLKDSEDSKADEATPTTDQMETIAHYSWFSMSGQELKSLTGIEWFTGLKGLNCENTQLTTLDIGSNTALTFLNCSNNQLTELDVSKNTALETLYCTGNELTTLDVSKSTALETLHCDGNKLSALDVSNSPALEDLDCGQNQITKLDVSHNPALHTLVCNNNRLTSLDISINTDLKHLDCSNWHVTDESGNPVVLNSNQLTDLDVKNNNLIEYLFCNDNKLIDLDVSNNSALKHLDCSRNPLVTLDVSHNLALEHLNCCNNRLTVLDVSQNTALKSLDCSSWYDQFNNLSNANQLMTLDVSHNTALESLYCYNNQLAVLDVSNNPTLAKLHCGRNHLTALNVNNNAALTFLRCFENQLSHLDVSRNPALEDLKCGYNQLTALDVSKNTELTELNCEGNRFSLLTDVTRFDLNTLPGAFDVTKASEWTGATVSGTSIQIAPCARFITYTYDMGNGHRETFTLERKVTGTVSHNFGKWVTTTSATATTEGRQEQICSRCGYKAYRIIPATGESGGTGGSSGGGGPSKPSIKPVTPTPKPEQPTTPVNPFIDVSNDAYYHDAVLWAVERKITNGVTEDRFSPDSPCSRGQIVTFLWRMVDSPVVKDVSNSFSDVVEGSFCYNAVLWAAKNGITTGISVDLFGTDMTCTRGQMAVLLYRYAGSPTVKETSRFADVAADSYYSVAIAWATEQGITNGTTETTFSPDAVCTRAQIVAFLYRAFTK